jgi:hypothetical protein
MVMNERMARCLRILHLSFSLALSLILLGRPAQAEQYVAAQFGVAIPQNLSNVEFSGGGSSLSGNDLSMHKSLVYGFKWGYYFESAKWLGLETEVFNTTPNTKQQDLIVGGMNLGTAPGGGFPRPNLGPG